MKKIALEISGITKNYSLGKTTVEALRGVSYCFHPGYSYAIVGPSGSGKSSLLHILGCLDTPTGGEYAINGNQVSGLIESKRTQIRAKEIGFVFQNFQLNPILTTLDNVSIALRIGGIKMKEAKIKATEMLVKVGLGNHLKHYPNELSGGQRQRVAIARALVKKPSLLLADEPTGNLDSVTSDEIVKLLISLPREEGTTVIIVTHNPDIAKQCNHTLTIKDGLIIN
jgi:putative ABC transport system ATP-binding protein